MNGSFYDILRWLLHWPAVPAAISKPDVIRRSSTVDTAIRRNASAAETYIRRNVTEDTDVIRRT